MKSDEIMKNENHEKVTSSTKGKKYPGKDTIDYI